MTKFKRNTRASAAGALLAATVFLTGGCKSEPAAADPLKTTPVGGEVWVTPTPADLTSNVGDKPFGLKIAGLHDKLSAIDYGALERSIVIVDPGGKQVERLVRIRRPNEPPTTVRENMPKGAPTEQKPIEDDSLSGSSELALVEVTPLQPLTTVGWHYLAWSHNALKASFTTQIANAEGDRDIARFAIGTSPVIRSVTHCKGKLSFTFSQPMMYSDLADSLRIQATDACRFPASGDAAEMAEIVSVFCPAEQSIDLSAAAPIKAAAGGELSLLSGYGETQKLGSDAVKIAWNLETPDGCRLYIPPTPKP